jgi:protein AaeX
MPRELSFFGVLIPALLPLFLASVVLLGVLDRLLGAAGLYRRLWHPALARLALFACIFGGLTAFLYP